MKGNGDQAKAYIMCTRGRGLTHLKSTLKSPFLHVFCDVFIFNVLLSYFAAFGNDIHYCFIKHLLRLFYSPFLYRITDWAF